MYPYQKEIDAFFDAHKEEMLADIAELIEVKSVRGEAEPGMPFGRECKRVLDVGQKIAEKYGFRARNIDNHVVTYDLNDKEPVLASLVHLDVVPEGEGWVTDPYTMVEKDGRIYGRGTLDNKGPAGMMFHCMRAAREIVPEMRHGCRVIMGCNEESGMEDIKYYQTKEKMPPMTIVPDIYFPVTNTEKGAYRPKFRASWPEDKGLPRITHFTGGHTTNIIPQYADLTIEGMTVAEVRQICDRCAQATGVKFDVTQKDGLIHVLATGQSGHAAFPETGNNALTAALELASQLPLADSRGFAVLKALHRLFPHGDGYGGGMGVKMHDDIAGDLTLTFSVFQFGLTGFDGMFDSRTALCATKENLQDVIDRKFAECDIEVYDRSLFRNPHHVPEESKFVQTLLRCYEDVTGRKGSCSATGGNTYGHDIEGAVGFGNIFPEDETSAHGANEYNIIDKIILGAKVYTLTIIELCK